jgi:hypothetical protein
MKYAKIIIVAAVVGAIATGWYILKPQKSAEQLASDNPAGAAVDTVKPSPEISEAALPEGATVDADGFTRMPGEASRGGGGYYVTGDVCEEFSVKFVEGITGKKVYRTETGIPGNTKTSVCQYFISQENKNTMFQIGVNWLNAANQKLAHDYLGWKTISDSRIQMQNQVVVQENGKINTIMLVLAPDKFISIDRSAADALSEDETMNLAIKLADKVKNFQ